MADSSKRWHIVLRCTIRGPSGLLFGWSVNKVCWHTFDRSSATREKHKLRRRYWVLAIMFRQIPFSDCKGEFETASAKEMLGCHLCILTRPNIFQSIRGNGGNLYFSIASKNKLFRGRWVLSNSIQQLQRRSWKCPGQSEAMAVIFVFPKSLSGTYFTQLSMTQGCVVTLIVSRRRCSAFKVISSTFSFQSVITLKWNSVISDVPRGISSYIASFPGETTMGERYFTTPERMVENL